MDLFSSFRKRTSTESVDRIEAIVAAALKPHGFRRFGRTLHRFVDGDISQVVHLQNGCPQKGILQRLWVNLGIRVPECAERTFSPAQPQKRYYPEYHCNIRSRLGELVDGADTSFNLRKNPEKIGQQIVQQLQTHVLPVFDALNSRDAILQSRRDYAAFDSMFSRLILLDEAMIWGRRGDFQRASACFCQYYTGVRSACIAGQTDPGAARAHLAYLEQLAETLGIALPPQ